MSGKATERPVVFWDCSDHAEVLHHSTKKEAIEDHLDSIFADEPADRKEKITVYGYAHMVVPAPTQGDAVELVEEWFEGHWEEYVGEDGPNIPNGTYEAALIFLAVLHRYFVPWACEQVTSEEVDVLAWIEDNRPDWLEEK